MEIYAGFSVYASGISWATETNKKTNVSHKKVKFIGFS